ncbi:MAG: RAMP superfamily CRISPR-associated protein [Candidatus Helarchaeota archaeon]
MDTLYERKSSEYTIIDGTIYNITDIISKYPYITGSSLKGIFGNIILKYFCKAQKYIKLHTQCPFFKNCKYRFLKETFFKMGYPLCPEHRGLLIPLNESKFYCINCSRIRDSSIFRDSLIKNKNVNMIQSSQQFRFQIITKDPNFFKNIKEILQYYHIGGRKSHGYGQFKILNLKFLRLDKKISQIIKKLDIEKPIVFNVVSPLYRISLQSFKSLFIKYLIQYFLKLYTVNTLSYNSLIKKLNSNIFIDFENSKIDNYSNFIRYSSRLEKRQIIPVINPLSFFTVRLSVDNLSDILTQILESICLFEIYGFYKFRKIGLGELMVNNQSFLS